MTLNTLKALLKPSSYLALLLLLSGCVHHSAIIPPANLQAHQARIESVNNWEIIGKLGVRSDSDSGSASLNWQQQPKEYRIFLSAPLGQKHIEILGSNNQVELRQSGAAPMSAPNAEALIKQATGWTIPVTQLNFWVRGIPAPTGKITRLTQTPDGLIAQLEQAGWQLDYSQYQNQSLGGETLILPSKIIATYKDIRLTLIVRRWRDGAPTAEGNVQ